MTKQREVNTEKIKKLMYILAIVISLLYIFLIGQPDMRTITGWGYDLLESLRIGELYNFPAYTNDLRHMPSNYTLLSNMTTAIWLGPVYLIQNITGSEIAFEVYQLWYKCLIGAVHFLNVYLLRKTLVKINLPAHSIDNICILYMLSTVVLISVIGQGQIDMICLLFTILGYNYLIDGKYCMMSLMFGIGIIYKPFIILVATPIIILLSNKIRIKTIATSVILITPYIVNLLLTHILMPEYGEYVDLVNQQSKEIMGSNRIEEIFALRINSVLIFIGAVLILCFICYYISWHKKTKDNYYIIMPTVSFLLYAVFVSPAAYWFIIIVPMLLLMGQLSGFRNEFYLANLGFNTGCMVNVYFSEKQYSPSPQMSILGYITGKNRDVFLYRVFDNTGIVYIQFISITLFVVSAIIIVGLYIYSLKKKEAVINKSEHVLFILQCLPAIIYFVFATVEFAV